MSNTRRRLTVALGCFLGSLVFTVPSAALADESDRPLQPFSTASLEGDYAVVGTYGANVARLLGTYHADGHGNIKGTAKVNLPGAGTERVVVSISYEGTYVIDEDGTGVIDFEVTLPGGGKAVATLDLVITKAKGCDGAKIATELATAQRQPSSVVQGEFITHISTRLPDTSRDRDRH